VILKCWGTKGVYPEQVRAIIRKAHVLKEGEFDEFSQEAKANS
jgi:hypothetical protein